MEIIIAFFLGVISLVLLRWFRRPIKRTAYTVDYHLAASFAPGMAKATKRVNQEWEELNKEYPNFLTPDEVFDLLTKRDKR